jgi:hypothetical protein
MTKLPPHPEGMSFLRGNHITQKHPITLIAFSGPGAKLPCRVSSFASSREADLRLTGTVSLDVIPG